MRGNCRDPNTFVGVAPDADLIMVKLQSDNDRLGEPVNLTVAITHIFGKASSAGKPAVINISLGDNLGPHDGTNLVEQFIDAMLIPSGRAIVKSAGNEGTAAHHASGTVAAAATENLTLTVPASQSNRVMLDLWYEGSDRFALTVTPPGGVASAQSPRARETCRLRFRTATRPS